MVHCPICGLGERCRNHWIATQDANGEITFHTGPMTASEDNLVLLQNKLGRPDLPALLEKISLPAQWESAGGKQVAYVAWPLDFRAAVNKALFPASASGTNDAPPFTFLHRLEDLRLVEAHIDTENCLPDELLYRVEWEITLAGLGSVIFHYVQILWDEVVFWAELLATPKAAEQACKTIALFFGGLVDPLRERFTGQEVDVLFEGEGESAAERLQPGTHVDEIALHDEPGIHLGEEIEAWVNRRRIQPLLRDALLALGFARRI